LIVNQVTCREEQKSFCLKILLEKPNQFVWDITLEDCFIFNIEDSLQRH